MPILTPDTSEQLDLSPIPAGVYPADITKTEAGISKSSGAPKLVAGLSVTVDGKKKPRTAHLVISGPGSGTFDQLLRAAGMEELADAYKNPAVQPKPPFDTDSLVGKTVNVIIEEQIYNGQKGDQIRGFLKA